MKRLARIAAGRSGEVDWVQRQYNVSGSGAHVFRWQYVKDYSGEDGEDRAWVDYLQWTGAGEPPEQSGDWETVTYVYDPAGRRIAKAIDGDVAVRYLYDGDHVIAEYDGDDVLLRRFIYGPGVDQPICMIEAGGSYAGAYYYHFDGLGSVVALSDADGDTVQTYEYSVYGQPAAADPNHPNPYLFTARRFDTETGLYHYRARAYNATIGRFLQTDPAGQGMNWYAYCGNNPVNCSDPTGMLLQSTGKIMVANGPFTPSYTTWWPFGGDTLSLIILMNSAVVNAAIDSGIAVSPVASVASVLSDLEMCFSYKFLWHAFIEVVDYNDRNHDCVIDNKDLSEGEAIEDLKGSPFWLEVTGVLSLDDQKKRGMYVSDQAAGGYLHADVAYRAAALAVFFLSKIGGQVPKTYMDPLYMDAFSSGLPLDYEHPYMLTGYMSTNSKYMCPEALLPTGMPKEG